jgi:hypothetical protein
VFSVLKTVIELYNIGVMQSFVKFDFVGKSQASTVSFELIFENYFCGSSPPRLCVFANEAIGEPSLSQ